MLLTLLNAALRRVHTRALARCCATDLPDVVRALAAELALELDEPTAVATTSTEMRAAVRAAIDAIESQHLSPEARARPSTRSSRSTSRPRRALLASLAAWSHTRTGGFVGSSITLLDELIREVLDLARYACVARADGKLDADECRELRRLLARVRSALDAFEGSITRAAEARPS